MQKRMILALLVLAVFILPMRANTFTCAAFQIVSEPEGAIVTLVGSNEYLGTTPTEIFTVRMDQFMGWYGYQPGRWFNVMIRKAGYHPMIQQIFVPFNEKWEDYAKKRPQVFRFFLEPIYYYYPPYPVYPQPPQYTYKTQVTIATDPPGTALYANEQYIGMSPLEYTALWNPYVDRIEIRAERSGYTTNRRMVTPQDRNIFIVLQPRW